MNKQEAFSYYASQLEGIKDSGVLKAERIITTPQSAHIFADGKELLNMCANNYLGLADNPELVAAAKAAYDEYGYGLASVRFICGTQSIHKKLEAAVARFFGTEDTILYSSCFDANGGLFEVMLTAEDAVISDELNHASIIDGVRLCKAKRYRYKNNDMADLEAQLQAADAAGARMKLIATDGVFSMDGIIANLKGVCDLADKYGAMVMVDDSHASGFVGKNGRGTVEYCGVQGRVDVITGTFGKALGGASGGFTTGKKEIIDLLRQRSRPYLFSNTLAPAVAAGTLKCLEMLEKDTSLRDHLEEITVGYREALKDAGFDIIDGTHPCVPIMLYDEHKAARMAQKLYELGIYAVSFTYPVVPKGKARIRTQVSAAHTKEDLEFAVRCFIEARRQMEEEDAKG
ncbi:MAG: glycine C-acetyltransferase [Candidatus Faecousia sp.]|nr:glycine C-acetyltransferase [Clostridiales bacterium]MDD7651664.1 glycine C-acetyltransferase [Bacillota bacterium]MDY4220022.1 glycine C-acetyltransferase [Candidatus Faecousia sp.]